MEFNFNVPEVDVIYLIAIFNAIIFLTTKKDFKDREVFSSYFVALLIGSISTCLVCAIIYLPVWSSGGIEAYVQSVDTIINPLGITHLIMLALPNLLICGIALGYYLKYKLHTENLYYFITLLLISSLGWGLASLMQEVGVSLVINTPSLKYIYIGTISNVFLFYILNPKFPLRTIFRSILIGLISYTALTIVVIGVENIINYFFGYPNDFIELIGNNYHLFLGFMALVLFIINFIIVKYLFNKKYSNSKFYPVITFSLLATVAWEIAAIIHFIIAIFIKVEILGKGV